MIKNKNNFLVFPAVEDKINKSKFGWKIWFITKAFYEIFSQEPMQKISNSGKTVTVFVEGGGG